MIKKLRAKHVPETAYLIMFTIFSAAAFIEGTTLTHVFGVDRLMALTYRIYSAYSEKSSFWTTRRKKPKQAFS